MRVSKEEAEQNRERIVSAACRLFREHGFEGVGVDAVAEAAGLTYGGLYSRFGSKEALAAEAVARCFADSVSAWERAADLALSEGRDPFAAIVERYLTERHRDHPGGGCVLAAVGSEAPRAGASVRAAMAQGTVALIGVLARFAPGETEAQRSRNAVAALATVVGGLLVARAAAGTSLSPAALEAARSAALAFGSRPPPEQGVIRC